MCREATWLRYCLELCSLKFYFIFFVKNYVFLCFQIFDVMILKIIFKNKKKILF
jgi:hypothetical protein